MGLLDLAMTLSQSRSRVSVRWPTQRIKTGGWLCIPATRLAGLQLVAATDQIDNPAAVAARSRESDGREKHPRRGNYVQGGADAAGVKVTREFAAKEKAKLTKRPPAKAVAKAQPQNGEGHIAYAWNWQ
jgi:hypothetical protein